MRSPARAKQSQETCPNAERSFERLAQKGVQAAVGILPFKKRSRRQPVAFARQKRWRGLSYSSNRAVLNEFGFSLRNLRDLCASALSFLQVIFTAETQSTRRKRREPFSLVLIAALTIGVCVSCSGRFTKTQSSSTQETREAIDEAGRRVILPLRVDRIVSLAPNLTEIVYAVGAGNRLVGDTTYCDYPPEAKTVAKIGDTMNPSIERIVGLKPQIVLVSTASQLEAFAKQLDEQKIAVYVTNPRSLDEVFHSIETLGELFGEHDRSASLVADLRKRAGAVEAAVKQVKPVTVFYQVSGEPLYTIGRESYLTDLVRRAGGISVTADVPGAFPRFSDEAALAARPEAIIMSTGGSMGEANSTVASSLKNSPAVLNNRIYKIDGDHLSRPGPRLVNGLEEMARALHAEAFE